MADNNQNNTTESTDVVIAYMDLCGFTKYLGEDETKASKTLDYIGELLNKMKEVKPTGDDYIEYTQFSDSLFVFFRIRNDGLDDKRIGTFFQFIGLIQYQLFINYGIHVRGGIDRGNVRISKTVSGFPVVNAHIMESKIADWFRVLISDSVLEMIPPQYRGGYVYEIEGVNSIDYLKTTTYLDPELSFEKTIKAFRDKLVDVFCYESGVVKLPLPNKASTFSEYCERAKIINRYVDLLFYFNETCRNLGLDQYHIFGQIVHYPCVKRWEGLKEKINHFTKEKNVPLVCEDLRGMLDQFILDVTREYP